MNNNELKQQLRKLRTRGEIKTFGKKIDSDPVLYSMLREFTEAKFGMQEQGTPAKKMIRLLLDRSLSAQHRKNPIHMDAPFLCMNCGRDVAAGKGKIRDHCPFCLWGRHMDVVPGDRLSSCMGQMKPVSLENAGEDFWVHYECLKCSHRWRVRAHPDDNLHDLSRDLGDLR